ncbi:MAG: tRNA (guanosine(37)-N1)-methyltransferase TrmD [Vampirovibrionales bacterium]|nr:tRNA (guanosine(37)-N1)-methyltransferase TrmD [Vampirovibrionales bacterium]
MQFTLLSLFPEVIWPYLNASILGRGQQAGLLTVNVVNPRTFADPPHFKVDNAPYGGGDGMVLSCAPWHKAVASLLPPDASCFGDDTLILLTNPAGELYTQAHARRYAHQAKHLILLCGHYEGFDERLKPVLAAYGAPVLELSVGEYVLTGGELPALSIVDSVARLVPGVVQKAGSVENDSFGESGLLDYPCYTRPATYEGLPVPEVLLSGNHSAIAQWRLQQSNARSQNRL